MQVNTFLRYGIITGVFLLPFIPLVISTSMFFPFITGKNFLFRFIVEIIFGIWLILLVRDARYRPDFSWILAAAAVFLGVIALADFLGENISKSFWSNYERMDGLITQLHLFAYLLAAASVIKTERLWRRFFHVSIGVSVFVGLYGILQLAGEIVINQGGVRVDGPLGNATYLAVYMLFHVFFTALFAAEAAREKLRDASPILASGFVGFGLFAAWSFVRAGSPNIALGPYEKGLLVLSLAALALLGFAYARLRRASWLPWALYGAALFLQLSILYYTATRGAILGLIGGVLFSLLLLAVFGKRTGAARKAAAGLLAAVVVLVGGFFFLRDAPFVRESPVLGRLASISLEDGESRFLVWNMSIQGFKEHPVLGWGQGNFNLVFNKYYDAKMYKQEPWFDRAHNIVFDWLIAAGILGLASYLSIFAAVSYMLWFSRIGASSFSVSGKSILTGLLAAYFFQNLFVFDQIVSYILFFSVVAYIHARTSSPPVQSPAAAGGAPGKRRAKRKEHAASGQGEVAGHVFASVVILAMPFLVYAANYKGYAANANLLQAIAPQEEGPAGNIGHFKRGLALDSFGNTELREQLVQFAISLAGSDAPREIKDEAFTLARDEMAKQTERVPNDARYRLFLASLYLTYGWNDEAIAELEAALRISPAKQQIHYTLANAYLGKGEFGKAFDVTKEAYELEESNSEAKRYYAAAAIYAGRDNVAEELLAAYDEPPTDSIFINAYVKRGNYAKAAEIWERRIKREPGNPQHRISLAAAYAELGRVEDAVREIEKAIKLEPRFEAQGRQFIEEIRGR